MSDTDDTGLTRRQRTSTYAIITLISLMGGVEYAVILPTLYLRLESMNAATIFLGLTLSAFSFTGLFAAPIMGRIYDKTNKAVLIISLTNLFEFGGSIMYWLASSEWMVLASRLIAGLGNGYFSVVLAEVTHGTTHKNRTSVVSAIMAARQFGLILGPAFNLFLCKFNFYIGPFIVNNYTSPGLFMAVLWLIIQVMLMFMYYPLRPKKSVQEVRAQPINSEIMESGDITESNQETSSRAVKPATTYTLSYMCSALAYDEIIALLSMTFIAMFIQTATEALITPLANQYIGWREMKISLMYFGAGVVILVSFLLVHFASRKFRDRTLLIFGLTLVSSSMVWLFVWYPRLQSTPDDYFKNGVILMVGVFLDVAGLPFFFVCHVALFSKIVHGDIAGAGQGVRRVFGGLGSIMGPLWAGSMLKKPYIMVGALLAVCALGFVLLIFSFKRLLPSGMDSAYQNDDLKSSAHQNGDLRGHPSDRNSSINGEIGEKTPLLTET